MNKVHPIYLDHNATTPLDPAGVEAMIQTMREVFGIPDLCASTGAACHDRSVTLSHVLSAMGVAPEVGMGALRLSVGRSNTMGQIEDAARRIIDRVRGMRV